MGGVLWNRLRAARARLKSEGSSTQSAKDRERERRTDFVEDARRVTPHIAVENDGTVYFLPTRQKAGVDRFVKPEWKEERHLRRALAALDHAGVGAQRTTFVDVGAHIGTTAVTAVRTFGFESAVAVEPEPSNYRLLRANLAINGLESTVQTFNVAVSNRVGSAQLGLRETMGAKHRLLKANETKPSMMLVPLTTLDALVDDAGLDPAAVGLLWLDIEGHELEALQAGRRLLERSVPIVMEFIPRGLEEEDRLATLGDVLSEHYTHVLDLRPRPRAKPEIRVLGALPDLARHYRRGFTDLLVFRSPASDSPARTDAR
jgi:FkbM family methyltransferase